MNKAFTLIELAISIAIISLIIGGITVGQHVINTAQIRKQISDVEKVNAAVNSFLAEYNCLPGDCANATQFFTSASQPTQVTNGDDDGKIRASGWETGWALDLVSWYVFTDPPAEWDSVFDHLAAAGLWDIKQYDETSSASNVPGIGYPKLHVSGGIKDSHPTLIDMMNPGGMVVGYETGYLYVNAGNKIKLGLCGNGLNYMGCSMSTDTARTIDEKIDDGKPYTGKAYLMSYDRYVYRIAGSGYDDTGTRRCGDEATNTYYTSDIGQGGCSLAIEAAF